MVSEKSIHKSHWLKAEELTQDVDQDDVAFVALALHLDAFLWTGDKKLVKGLLKGGFEKFIDTQYLKSQL